jgi:hypothetical protein
MAQSLFGLTPEQIQEARRLRQEEAINRQAQQFGMFGPLYAAGRGMAQQGIESIAGLFSGMQDPQLQKATNIQNLVKGKDLTNSTQLASLAQELTQLGYTQEAALVAAEAQKLLGQTEDRALRSQETRARIAALEEQAEQRKEAATARKEKVDTVGTTSKGLTTYRKGTDPQVYVTDEEGKEAKYDPKKHGRFETAADRIAQRGVQIRDIPGPGGIGVIGREVYDSMTGNVIRREYLPGYGPGARPTGPTAPAQQQQSKTNRPPLSSFMAP